MPNKKKDKKSGRASKGIELPKSVHIYGMDFPVKLNPKHNGGSINYECIEIGTDTPGLILQTFLHEVIEGILDVNGLRYQSTDHDNGNDDIMFIFSHKDFENIVPQIVTAIKDIIKE